MRLPQDVRENLRSWRLEFLRDVNVPEGVVDGEVVDREPLEVGDALVVREGDGDLIVQVAGIVGVIDVYHSAYTWNMELWYSNSYSIIRGQMILIFLLLNTNIEFLYSNPVQAVHELRTLTLIHT